ncbi:MAG: 16S rRNA (uracil(1498)-N(3))-methyltransferase [Alphaproteobacteria bacterium]
MAIRLYVEADLAAGAGVTLAGGQAHYLRQVMRKGAGAEVLLFNGRDGEWRCTVAELDRHGGRVEVGEQRCSQVATVGPALLFAPVKKDRVDFLLEKATELGATALRPVITQRTVVERVNLDRYRAICVEAAEQCGRLDLPDLSEPAPLRQVLDAWPADARLLFADTEGGTPIAGLAAATDAILIGPEGGFSEPERTLLATATAISLGPRILRAETAAAAALAQWQARFGSSETV